MRIVANLSLRSRLCQDLVREEGRYHCYNYLKATGGLVIVLNSCNIDKENPFLREWSILALRNLTENNEENQKFISELAPEGVPTEVQEEMNEIGVAVEVSEGTVQFKRQTP